MIPRAEVTRRRARPVAREPPRRALERVVVVVVVRPGDLEGAAEERANGAEDAAQVVLRARDGGGPGIVRAEDLRRLQVGGMVKERGQLLVRIHEGVVADAQEVDVRGLAGVHRVEAQAEPVRGAVVPRAGGAPDARVDVPRPRLGGGIRTAPPSPMVVRVGGAGGEHDVSRDDRVGDGLHPRWERAADRGDLAADALERRGGVNGRVGTHIGSRLCPRNAPPALGVAEERETTRGGAREGRREASGRTTVDSDARDSAEHGLASPSRVAAKLESSRSVPLLNLGARTISRSVRHARDGRGGGWRAPFHRRAPRDEGSHGELRGVRRGRPREVPLPRVLGGEL